MDKRLRSAHSVTILAAVGIVVGLLVGFGRPPAGYQSAADPSYPTVASSTKAATDRTTVVGQALGPNVSVRLLEPGIAAPGGYHPYQILFSNTGGLAARDVVITATMPMSATFASVEGFSFSALISVATRVAAEQVTMSLGSVEAGAVGILSTIILLPDNASGVITNSVRVSSIDPEITYTDNADYYTRTVAIPGSPNLSLSLEQSFDLPARGNLMRYTAHYANNGDRAAEGTVLTMTLPVSATYLRYSGIDEATSTPVTATPSVVGGVLSLLLGTLRPGETGTAYVDFFLDETFEPSTVLTGTVEIAAQGDDSDLTDDRQQAIATVTAAAAPDVTISKWHHPFGLASSGGLSDYFVYFENDGTAGADGVVITDTLPVSASLASYAGILYSPAATPITVTPGIVGNQVVWPIGSLIGGGYGYIYPSVRVYGNLEVGTALTNTISITTISSESDSSNDSSRSVVSSLDFDQQPPSANFTTTPSQGTLPLEVGFLNSSAGGYSSVLWEFGDGVTGTLSSAFHVYESPGVYSVTLTVSSPVASSSLTRPAIVTVFPPVTAAFEAAPLTGTIPLTVTFTNLSTGDFSSSYWSFGDGGTSTDSGPSHTYSSSGSFTVTLLVEGLGGTDVITRAACITTDNWQHRATVTTVAKDNPVAGGSAFEASPSPWEELSAVMGRLFER